MKAALYTRVSSPGQATADAASLPEQERTARGLVEGMEVVEHYCDAGRSATKDNLDNRPEMRRLIAGAAAKKFTHLAVYHEDRLARQTEVAAQIALALRKSGVTVLTPRGPLDLASFGGKLMFYVTALMAEEEAHRIRERCDNGKRGYAMRGDFPQWQQPFGYRWEEGDLRRGVPNRLHPIPDELATVREVYRLAVEEGRTTAQIAAMLGRSGLKTRGKLPKGQRASKIGGEGGTRWSPSVVLRMLKDPRYKGEWRVWAEGEHEWFARADLVPEVAVGAEVWERAQAARKHHRKRTRRQMKHAYLLNSFLFCRDCGSPLMGHGFSQADGPVVRYYQANKQIGNKDCPCRGRYVPAGPLEAETHALLRELAEDPASGEAYARALREDKLPADREELARLESKLGGLDDLLDSYIRLRAQEEITAEELLTHRQKVTTDREAWGQRAAELRTQIAGESTRAQALDDVRSLAAQAQEATDLEGLRWHLAQLPFFFILGCDDWSLPGPQRHYTMDLFWGLEVEEVWRTVHGAKTAASSIASGPFRLPM